MGAAAIIPAALNTITGLIAGNQARQDAKHANDLANQAVGAAKDNYSGRAFARNAGQNLIQNPGQYDYSSDYANGPKYQSLNDALLNQTKGGLSKTTASLTDSPDRLAQVRTALADFDKQAAPQMALERRKVGQSAAALGKLGAGSVNTSLGNIESDYERNRQAMQNSLIADAIDKGQNDKYNTLSALTGVNSSQYGQAANERGTENSIAQQNIGNRVSQTDRQRAATNQDFGKGVTLSEFGYGNDPSNALFQGANVARGQAAQNAQGAGDAFGAAGKFASLSKLFGGGDFAVPSMASIGSVNPSIDPRFG